MRDPDRIPALLTALVDAWHRYPDLRLGQLIINACPPMGDPFNVEDDVMLAGLQRLAGARESVAMGLREDALPPGWETADGRQAPSAGTSTGGDSHDN